MLKGKNIVAAPNLTGKYAFASISVLLACSVIRFEFGFEIMTYTSTILIGASIFNYQRVLSFLKKGEAPPEFNDKPVFKYIRMGISIILVAVIFFKLVEKLMN